MIETTIAIAVVVGLVEAIKKAFKMPSDYAALLSIALSVGIIFLTKADTISASDAIFTGLLVGLSASGLYSGTKATKKAIDSKK